MGLYGPLEKPASGSENMNENMFLILFLLIIIIPH